MANSITVARPYAKAILSLAQATNSYAQWSKMLEFLNLVILDSRVSLLLKNQVIASSKKADFLNSLAPERLTKEGQNLVKILAYNRRLLIIPELYNLYENLRKEAEHIVTLKITLAQDLVAVAMDNLQKVFASKLKGQIIIETEIEANLIGGGKLKIGDRVLDSTIKSTLKELYKHLTQ